MPVSQHETALSRGRLPTYMRRHVHHLVGLLLGRRNSRARNISRFRLLPPQYVLSFMSTLLRGRRSDLLSSLYSTLYFHYYSYDMFVRPTILFQDPPLQNPVEEIPSATFYQVTGFWPGQFKEIVENLTLIPDRIVCQMTRCSSSKQVTLFFAVTAIACA